ncbi:hypothetical protein CANINC_000455 [Pichia inconspicua]|uniref:Nucleoporin NDC1 n=1 Tax=Pichia inconspicua TaxID=52247 RepID=A0A4T0X6H3_9ASCO|nr:hypothetical protein CANINC_000455 [[Candida] inconspicua]
MPSRIGSSLTQMDTLGGYQRNAQSAFSDRVDQIVNQQKQRKQSQLAQKPLNSKIQTYNSIYSRIFSNRMRFYYRLSAILAFVTTFLITFPFKANLIFFPVKFLMIWTGFLAFQQGRSATITTSSASTSNYIQKVIFLLSSKKTYILAASIFFNAYIFGIILYAQSNSSLRYYLETPTKTIKPFVNDDFAFFIFFILFSTFIYTWSYISHERFLLQPPIGTFRQEPLEYLQSMPLRRPLILSILRSFFSALSIPLLYHFFFRNIFFKVVLKPIIFICDLNHQLPRSDFSVTTLATTTIYTWVLFVCVDLLNELFNAYALVGCLVVNKPISFHSNTQFLTLMDGLKDIKHPLVRLTAYQELAYLSTSPDYKDRHAFYDVNNWTLLLTEFYFVLNNTAKSARSDLPKRNTVDELKGEKVNYLKKKISLFGNLKKYESNLDFEFNFDLKNGEDAKAEELQHDKTVFHKDNEQILGNTPTVQRKLTTFEEKFNEFAYATINRVSEALRRFEIYARNYFNMERLDDIKETNSVTFQLYIVLRDIGELLRRIFLGTIDEQSNKRIPNKEIVAFAIISLTELLIHSKIEDKKHIVMDSLTESLTLLTKVYKGTSEFLSNPPVKITNNHFSVLIINELTISYFFKLVIYYNSLVKDLLLPPEVFKLAKWCTDLALEQQREKKHVDILE